MGYLVLFLLLVFFCRKMALRRGVSDEQGRIANLHPFYVFPTNISRDVLARYNTRLGWLHNRDFAIAATINWQRLWEVGLVERLNPFLTKTFMGN